MLAGVRVLDLTTGGALLAGRLLADLGADVIAVEPPTGNPTRSWAPFWHDQAGPDTSLFWLAYSHSKRSVTIDMHHANGRELFRRLLRTADVLLESFPPGSLDTLELEYATVAQDQPQLIWTSMTPFGQTGPYRCYRATDLILMAMGGSAFLIHRVRRPRSVSTIVRFWSMNLAAPEKY